MGCKAESYPRARGGQPRRRSCDQPIHKLSPVWREKDNLLRSVPGVGEQLSVTLLAHLPELGALDRKRIAVLAEVALINWDSGQMRG